VADPAVLIVDDDAGMVESLTDILGAKRFHVTGTTSGETALALVRGTRFDAVLMDIVMPGLDGVAALRSIKRSAPGTPVIMMTAFARHELVEEARTATAMAVLLKPLEMDEVLALLARATGRAEAPGA
jgi:DNA-binding NtrC family response regulator